MPNSIKSGKRKKTGELQLFLEIWNERPHYSEVSGKALNHDGDMPVVHYFSHLLPKSTHSELRLCKDNIMLMTPKEHYEWDFGSRDDPKWKKAKEKRDKLKYIF